MSALANEARLTRRPWGSFEVLDEGEGFKVKRLVVKPGASLSLQLHRRRAEHWVVVAGEARVLNGRREALLGPDESTRIAPGTAHRISNAGASDCVLIEVQVGDYTGEDDIVRLADQYGRS